MTTANASGNWVVNLASPLPGTRGLRTMSTVPDNFTITGLAPPVVEADAPGDGKLYLTSEEGEVHVVAAGPEFESLAVNDMGSTLELQGCVAVGPASIVAARLSICQDCAAPLEITSTTARASSPARSAKFSASARPWTKPAMQI